ncbi:zinc-binding dehydrogenase [Pseudokineococcus basanitobsidens]|uniref:Zinc-binding dehydrogenase n=1 Tax=Pseudokineococcus basanitobsidens TaxID=1926649 RepID=A0ABU8RID0_9ACTN
MNHLEDTASLEDRMARVADGTIALRVAGTVPAERAAEAHRRLEVGEQRGRVVLTF